MLTYFYMYCIHTHNDRRAFNNHSFTKAKTQNTLSVAVLRSGEHVCVCVCKRHRASIRRRKKNLQHFQRVRSRNTIIINDETKRKRGDRAKGTKEQSETPQITQWNQNKRPFIHTYISLCYVSFPWRSL